MRTSGMDLFFASPQLSKLKGSSTITVRKIPEEEITRSSDAIADLYSDPQNQYATAISKLIHPNITGSNTRTCSLKGGSTIIIPSHGSSLTLFNDGGIAMSTRLNLKSGL